ncbi:MAG TPA: carboxypeptidase-like regulatory domain-containing protein [Pyrinomonadaceae bacterium]|nr:carboxypeptidase-like regulatory domain-containing protein [Pyrinomonadaceae bacterium]
MTLSSFTLLQAQTVTFGQFFQRNGTQDFVFTNNVTSASFQTITDGSAILFIYQNVANLPSELQGPQLAHITITAVTSAPAFQIPADPPRDVQPFDQTVYIRIIRDTPAQSGTNTRRNLLTAIITPDGTAKASLSGDDLSDAVAFTASTARQNIQFSSDFITFAQSNQTNNLGLSFSSVFPLLSIGPGGFYNSFTAAGSGTFASNPAPVFNPPTAASVAINGRVFSAYGTSVSRAVVTMTDSSGASRTASTNNLGYFRFTDIPAGQAVTLSVTAKSGTYQSQVFNLNDNLDEVNFYPIP